MERLGVPDQGADQSPDSAVGPSRKEINQLFYSPLTYNFSSFQSYLSMSDVRPAPLVLPWLVAFAPWHGYISPWAFGQTEPIGSVPRSFGQFGHQKPGTDRSLQKTKTEEVRSRLVRFGLGHDRTNRT